MRKSRTTLLLSLLALIVIATVTSPVASAAGPYWYVNGTKLTQGSKGVKLLSKGLVAFKATFTGIVVTISCGYSAANGTIDGNGTRQGQDKAVLVFEQCKTLTVPASECKSAEPIKTNQIKSHLVIVTSGGGEKIADLLEPTQGSEITTITLATCGILTGPHTLHGTLVAVIEPQEMQVVEDELKLPTTPILKAKHEGSEVNIGLFLGTAEATLAGEYGARLQSSEPFGAFRT